MKTYNNKLEKNLKVNYIFTFFRDFNITSAIWVLYLSFKGFSLVEIGLLESIFHITSFLGEMPTGVVADIYGRKISVVIGRIMAITSTILIINSNTFMGFALSFILSALSYNLNSGAADSLVYDSLKQLNKEDQYKQVAGTSSFLISIAQGMAIFLGGILSDYRFIYAYILALVIETTSLIISTKFTEPTIEKEIIQGNVFLNQFKQSIKILREKRLVLYLILFSALIGTAGTTVFFYSQKHFENIHFSKTAIGIIFGIDSLVSALSSKFAYKLEKTIKAKGVIIILPILNVISLIGLAFSEKYYTIAFFLISSFISGTMYPIFSDYINSLIPSEYRATILSFDSLCFSVFMICVFPLVGYLAERIGITHSFGVIAVIFIPAIIFIMFKIQLHKEKSEVA